ncbi:hypothetical protein HDV01_003401 [Terramyces sp. JEL0728]|nr:hypothetical protein HDV01_003401 [Terramyces sp. JEL0728]
MKESDGELSLLILSGADCASSTVYQAMVYFPSGTYLISSAIDIPYYTQMVGNYNDMPVIKASVNFKGFAMLDSDKYFDEQDHVGLWMDNGSGGFMSDLKFQGGNVSMWMGNQQFTVRNVAISGANTGIYLNWGKLLDLTIGWQWSFQNVRISDCDIGIDMSAETESDQKVAGVTIIDSTFTECKIGVKTIKSKNSTPAGAGTLLLENIHINHVPNVVVGVDDTLLVGGSGTIDSWGQGRIYDVTGKTDTFTQGLLKANTRPSSLVDGSTKESPYFSREKPQYQNCPASSFINVKEYGVKGDGVTDDADAINYVLKLNFDSGDCKVFFFPMGSYIIKSTITVPVGTRMVGETWSQIQATGSFFADPKNPQPAIRVGVPGDTGIIEISDFLFTHSGPVPGAILVQWNVHESTQGSAAMWDCHFRVGGSIDTKIRHTNCPKTSAGNLDCMGAFMLMHVTAQSSGYFENVWGWTADHDLDIKSQDQINVYTGRGFLIESADGPVWLYGTASEHNALYQYQISGANNVFMSIIQTETPYWQPASSPLLLDVFEYNDPSIIKNESWALNIDHSSEIFLYGAGLYNFFSNYAQQPCLDASNCQQALIHVAHSKHLFLYSINTKGSSYMISVGQSNFLAIDYKSNMANFTSTVLQIGGLSGSANDIGDDDEEDDDYEFPQMGDMLKKLDEVMDYSLNDKNNVPEDFFDKLQQASNNICIQNRIPNQSNQLFAYGVNKMLKVITDWTNARVDLEHHDGDHIGAEVDKMLEFQTGGEGRKYFTCSPGVCPNTRAYHWKNQKLTMPKPQDVTWTFDSSKKNEFANDMMRLFQIAPNQYKQNSFEVSYSETHCAGRACGTTVTKKKWNGLFTIDTSIKRDHFSKKSMDVYHDWVQEQNKNLGIKFMMSNTNLFDCDISGRGVSCPDTNRDPPSVKDSDVRWSDKGDVLKKLIETTGIEKKFWNKQDSVHYYGCWDISWADAPYCNDFKFDGVYVLSSDYPEPMTVILDRFWKAGYNFIQKIDQKLQEYLSDVEVERIMNSAVLQLNFADQMVNNIADYEERIDKEMDKKSPFWMILGMVVSTIAVAIVSAGIGAVIEAGVSSIVAGLEAGANAIRLTIGAADVAEAASEVSVMADELTVIATNSERLEAAVVEAKGMQTVITRLAKLADKLKVVVKNAAKGLQKVYKCRKCIAVQVLSFELQDMVPEIDLGGLVARRSISNQEILSLPPFSNISAPFSINLNSLESSKMPMFTDMSSHNLFKRAGGSGDPNALLNNECKKVGGEKGITGQVFRSSTYACDTTRIVSVKGELLTGAVAASYETDAKNRMAQFGYTYPDSGNGGPLVTNCDHKVPQNFFVKKVVWPLAKFCDSLTDQTERKKFIKIAQEHLFGEGGLKSKVNAPENLQQVDHLLHKTMNNAGEIQDTLNKELTEGDRAFWKANQGGTRGGMEGIHKYLDEHVSPTIENHWTPVLEKNHNDMVTSLKNEGFSTASIDSFKHHNIQGQVLEHMHVDVGNQHLDLFGMDNTLKKIGDGDISGKRYTKKSPNCNA